MSKFWGFLWNFLAHFETLCYFLAFFCTICVFMAFYANQISCNLRNFWVTLFLLKPCSCKKKVVFLQLWCHKAQNNTQHGVQSLETNSLYPRHGCTALSSRRGASLSAGQKSILICQSDQYLNIYIYNQVQTICSCPFCHTEIINQEEVIEHIEICSGT